MLRKKVVFMVSLALSVLLTIQGFAMAQTTDIDYDNLSMEELQLIIDSANDAIRRNHSVSHSDTSYLESKTKSVVEKLVSNQDSNPSWRWFDWSYLRDWHIVTVITEVKINGTWLPLEVVYTDESGDFEMVYTKLDNEVISGEITDTAKQNTSNGEKNDRLSEEDPEISEQASNTESTDNFQQPEDDPIIAQKGTRNETVQEIQTMLIQLGYLSGKADGDFGNKTKDAVESFQKAHNISIDGIVTESVYITILNEYNNLPKDIRESAPDNEQSISISAKKLNDAFQDNEVSANQQYKDQIIDVNGKLESVKKTFGTVYVRLAADDYGIFTVACAMRKDQEQSVGALKKGQNVTIRGKCTGLSIIEVYLDDCKIIN